MQNHLADAHGASLGARRLAVAIIAVLAGAPGAGLADVPAPSTTPFVDGESAWAPSAPGSSATSNPWLAPGQPAEDGEQKKEGRWYGGQTLAADGLAVGLIVAGGVTETGPLSALGVGTYLLGAPIVHGVHDGPWLGSVGLRLALPAIGALVAPALFSCGEADDEDDDAGSLGCALVAVSVGGGVGMLSAIFLDGVFLARERTDAKLNVARPPAWGVSPFVSSSAAGVTALGAF